MARTKQAIKRAADPPANKATSPANKRARPHKEPSLGPSKEASQSTTATITGRTPEPSVPPADAFLWYPKGTVIISLSKDPMIVCQLHRAMLERNSSWFANQMIMRDKQAVTLGKSTVASKYCFHLEETARKGAPYLLQPIAICSDRGANQHTKVYEGQGSTAQTKASELTTQRATGAVIDPTDTISQLSPTSQMADCTAKGVNFTHKNKNFQERGEPDFSLRRAKVQARSDTNGAEEEAKTGECGITKADGTEAVEEMEEVKTEPTVDSKSPIAGRRVESMTVSAITDQDPSDHPNRLQHKLRQDYVKAHKDLLGMYYSHLPGICSNDIDQALSECERLVVLAKHYGSLRIVQPYLSSILTNYRHTLFTTIAKDPPRWLTLSIDLESPLIFSESLVHCPGAWPSSPWPTPTEAPKLKALITSKAEELATHRTEVDTALFINSLSDSEDDPVNFATSPESWMVVQFWRDWLLRQMFAQRVANEEHHGTHYRLMRSGGDAYLPKDSWRTLISEIWGHGMGTWDSFDDDLATMKNYAKDHVAALTENKLMIDPEAAGIPYLTCVEVTPADYPWL